MEKDRDLIFDETSHSSEQNIPARNFLLIIGIDQYEHAPKLHNAVRDAKAFRDILLDKYQFEAQYSIELFDQDATRKNILGKLAELEHVVNKQDNFILYFSGHGVMNERQTKGYWVPVDAESKTDYIPNSQIKDHLDEIQAHHIYLIADSCFSGSIINRSAEFSNRVEALPSRRVLSSGRKEVVSDGKPGDHSPFANCLLTYLHTHQGSLPASQLEQHIKVNTPKSSAQTPASAYIHGLGDQGGEFVFHPKGVIPNPQTLNSQHWQVQDRGQRNIVNTLADVGKEFITEQNLDKKPSRKLQPGQLATFIKGVIWMVIPAFFLPVILDLHSESLHRLIYTSTIGLFAALMMIWMYNKIKWKDSILILGLYSIVSLVVSIGLGIAGVGLAVFIRWHYELEWKRIGLVVLTWIIAGALGAEISSQASGYDTFAGLITTLLGFGVMFYEFRDVDLKG